MLKADLILLFLFSAISSTSFSAEAVWPSFRNGPQNRGVYSADLRPLQFSNDKRALQKITLNNNPLWTGPVIDEAGGFFAGSSLKNLQHFDKSGKKIWTATTKNGNEASTYAPAALSTNGLLIVPTGDGFLYAFNQKTGKELWAFKAGAAFESAVQPGPNGKFFAGNNDGKMYSVNDTGNEIWSFKTGKSIHSTPAFDPQGKWLVFGSDDGFFYLLEPDTGKLLDSYNIGHKIRSSPVVDYDGFIYVGSSDSSAYSFRVKNGKLLRRWQTEPGVGDLYSSPAFMGDHVVYTNHDGTVYAVSSVDGKPFWNFKTYARGSSSPVISQDKVVITSMGNGKIYALDLNTGERLWSYSTQGKSRVDSGLSVSGSGIITFVKDNTIYRLPYELCLKQPKIFECQFGGNDDVPFFGREMTAFDSTLAIETNGQFTTSRDSVGLFDITSLKLVVFKNGELQSNRRIDAAHIQIKSTPPANFKTDVSPDGQMLHLIPNTMLQPDTEYRIEISGQHIPQDSSWWKSWLSSKTFDFTFALKTQSKGSDSYGVLKKGAFLFHSFYSLAPAVVDIPILFAISEQTFFGTPFGVNEKTGTFLMHVTPAKNFSSLPDSKKTPVLNGLIIGHHLYLNGEDADIKMLTLRAVLKGAAPARATLMASTQEYKTVGEIQMQLFQSEAFKASARIDEKRHFYFTTAPKDFDRVLTIINYREEKVLSQKVMILRQNEAKLDLQLTGKGSTAIFLNENLVIEQL